MKKIFYIFVLCALIASCTSTNKAAKTADTKSQYLYLSKKAKKGDAESQFMLAKMYDNGEGTAVDKNQAFYWYTKAAEQGVAEAQYNLGWMYDNGKGTAVNKKQALYWYTKSAKQGDSFGQNNLGIMYLNGNGIAVDTDKAHHWLSMSAKQGNAMAQYNLGTIYFEEANKRRNDRWWAKFKKYTLIIINFICQIITNQTDTNSNWNKAAAISKQGIDAISPFIETEENDSNDPTVYDEKAFYWFTKSAKQGHAGAQYYLGLIYYNGYGTKSDKKTAAYWLRKSYANGLEEAKKTLNDLWLSNY
ncbi:MAG: tetratricopeptide repeat protein [Treponema phagedenis]|uniref:tetratricopeptide repeat protein n=1 Tax=Treponema phagedenis TaxID=162 RepID=UPI00046611F4|nr:tetratricopeptide repeat protein [Treponema phagedenis]